MRKNCLRLFFEQFASQKVQSICYAINEFQLPPDGTTRHALTWNNEGAWDLTSSMDKHHSSKLQNSLPLFNGEEGSVRSLRSLESRYPGNKNRQRELATQQEDGRKKYFHSFPASGGRVDLTQKRQLCRHRERCTLHVGLQLWVIHIKK